MDTYFPISELAPVKSAMTYVHVTEPVMTTIARSNKSSLLWKNSELKGKDNKEYVVCIEKPYSLMHIHIYEYKLV